MDKWECDAVVERTTDYIEGSLRAGDLARMAAHLHGCRACEVYLGEVRVTMLLMSELPTEPIPEALESSLLARYRERTASVSI